MMLAREMIPAFKQGAKLTPNEIAGMLGLPYVGNIFYVDPYAGSDTAGNAQDVGFKTVAKAFSFATSGNHDVIIIKPTGGTGRTTEPAAIAWNKRFVHLIGNAAPTFNSPRAGMNFTLASATTTPQFVVSENGCIFKNITFYQGVATSYGGVSVTGDYNYFGGCHFAGIMDATAGDSANARSLVLTGADDNVFEGCTIGSDTVNRSAASASLELLGDSARNVFRDCIFPMFADNAGAFFVKAASAANIDRFVLFQRCMFHNAAYSSATTITAGMSLHAAVGGTVILDACSILGATDWATDYTALQAINIAAVTGSNAGFFTQVAT